MEYRCYYCNSKLFSHNSEVPEDFHYLLSQHCHIVTEFECENPECNIRYVEEIDINGHLLFWGPISNK